jgi:electron transport complex protein RnfG
MTDRVEADKLTVAPPAPGTAPEQEPAEAKVSTFRLVATLAVAGILAGILIALVNQHTHPIIEAYRAEQLRKAVYEVLPGVARYDTYYLVDGALQLALPQGAKEGDFKRAYVGYDEAGQTKGVALSRGESGFQDIILVIFGFDPAAGTLSGMKVLESKETPGLGDKIFKDQAFVDQFFAGPRIPLVSVKAGAGKGDPNEIDAITGATISSKAVVSIINNAIEEWTPVLEQGVPEEAKP